MNPILAELPDASSFRVPDALLRHEENAERLADERVH